MKAILVIDNMPQDCCYCPCWRGGNNGFPFDDCTAMQRPLTVDERDNKPDWCPLKPMPNKQATNLAIGIDLVDGFKDGWNYGWNACLKEIEK